MKKLKKIQLTEKVKVLEKAQMKIISGGSGYYCGDMMNCHIDLPCLNSNNQLGKCFIRQVPGGWGCNCE